MGQEGGGYRQALPVWRTNSSPCVQLMKHSMPIFSWMQRGAPSNWTSPDFCLPISPVYHCQVQNLQKNHFAPTHDGRVQKKGHLLLSHMRTASCSVSQKSVSRPCPPELRTTVSFSHEPEKAWPQLEGFLLSSFNVLTPAGIYQFLQAGEWPKGAMYLPSLLQHLGKILRWT